MAWETGVASDLDDLLDKMCTFAVAEGGFTEITQIGSTGRQSDMYILQRGSIYWWFLGNIQVLTNYGDNGFLEMRMMNTQPNLSNRTTLNLGQRYLTKAQLWNKDDGPFTNYWFYSNGNNCLVVVEVVPNVFTHWCFGVLDKFSTWTGGEFLAGINMGSPGWNQTSGEWLIGTTAFSSYGSYPFSYDQGNASAYGANYLHYPQDSYGDYRDFAIMESTSADGQSCLSIATYNLSNAPPQNNIGGVLSYYSPNSFNSRAVLVPLWCFVYDTSSARRMILGHVSNMRFLNIELITPKEMIEVKWGCYPFIQKDGDNTVATITGKSGYAYERI
jgi:hypothetical protein